jgi:UDP-2,3-diacylglucosamine pyrophosphatase LpxH
MYEAVFLSDIHFGIMQNEALILEFLRELKTKKLILAGDVISFSVKDTTPNLDTFFNIIKSQDWELIYILGNHEKESLNFEKFANYFKDINILNEYSIDINGNKIHIEHGDNFHYKDPINKAIKHFMLKSKLKTYKKSSKKFKSKRNLYYKIKPLIKKILYKSYINYIKKEAIKRGANIAICGHLHEPEIKQLLNVKYINCGDWIKNCSYVTLNSNGVLELKYYKQKG